MKNFGKEVTKIIRECRLEWHCHEIVISQPEIADGYSLKGYGIIKNNKDGGLFLDFICLESNKRLPIHTSIPEDRFDEKQTLVLTATTIDGAVLSARDLYIETSFQQIISRIPGYPEIYRIGLRKIEICDSGEEDEKSDSFLYFEFNEPCSIPFNKRNTITCTLGSKSSSWNQADIEIDGITIKVIKHEDHMEVSAVGSIDSIAKLRDSVVFYIGYTCGIMVQPYFEHFKKASVSTRVIHSIERKKISKYIPPPISGYYKAQNGMPLDPHYDLLKKIYRLSIEKTDYFESIYAHWGRIWHSFFSNDISVPMLTVSISIDGILNDIFIPNIAADLRDETFEIEKTKMKEKISAIEEISYDHLNSIKLFIDRWGEVHSKKALQHLVKNFIIEKQQMKCWEKLRNSSAHPRLPIQDEPRMQKNIERTTMCLGLFYRLTLNVFSYEGKQYAYDNSDEELKFFQYINILH